jgi:protocatechuate 3,4-dioxygenase beta subunit
MTRRNLLKTLAAAPFAFVAARFAKGARFELTPEVPDLDDDDPTPTQTEGPYFKPKSPERASLLEKDIKGTKLVVEGRVHDVHGKPHGKALLDIWHCDANGVYDNVGYRLRGHLYANEDGTFKFETIVPGVYPGRTRHIHIKVQPKSGRILTTQLYFPGEIRNQNDGIFDKRLLMQMSEKDGGKHGAFDFVI